MAAAYYGHGHVVEILLEYGADPDAQCRKGCTALFYACAGGHHHVVNILLQNGANPLLPSIDGMIPREIALAANHVDIAHSIHANTLLRHRMPSEMILRVLSFLDLASLGRAAAVCHSWRILANDSLLWRRKCQQKQWVSPELDLVFQSFGLNIWKVTYGQNCYLHGNWRSGRCELTKLPIQPNTVSLCQWGNLVATASRSGLVRVIDLESKQPNSAFQAHGVVFSLVMNDAHVFSGNADGSLARWSFLEHEEKRIPGAHTDSISCLHHDDLGLVSCGFDGYVRTWDPLLKEDTPRLIIQAHKADVHSLKVLNHQIFITGSFDRTCRVWNRQTGEQLGEFTGHTVRFPFYYQ